MFLRRTDKHWTYSCPSIQRQQLYNIFQYTTHMISVHDVVLCCILCTFSYKTHILQRKDIHRIKNKIQHQNCMHCFYKYTQHMVIKNTDFVFRTTPNVVSAAKDSRIYKVIDATHTRDRERYT